MQTLEREFFFKERAGKIEEEVHASVFYQRAPNDASSVPVFTYPLVASPLSCCLSPRLHLGWTATAAPLRC